MTRRRKSSGGCSGVMFLLIAGRLACAYYPLSGQIPLLLGEGHLSRTIRQPDELSCSNRSRPGGRFSLIAGGQVHVFGQRVSARSSLSAEKWTRPRPVNGYPTENRV